MAKKARIPQRREDSLSRDVIIEASIALLDKDGESGLTFRALSQRLATGPGAIYGHITDKGDLLSAACDFIIADTMNTPAVGATPDSIIRSVALGLFDAIDAHPWVGSALMYAPGQLPMLRILESLGQQVRALGVPRKDHWATVSALLNYILGVGGRNAANGQFARAQKINRSDFLDTVSRAWAQLDPHEFPFTSSMAEQARTHDDRDDFLAGINLILKGIGVR